MEKGKMTRQQVLDLKTKLGIPCDQELNYAVPFKPTVFSSPQPVNELGDNIEPANVEPVLLLGLFLRYFNPDLELPRIDPNVKLQNAPWKMENDGF